MNPIKTIYIYYESSLINYLSKSTIAPPSSTCQLSFLEFQFPLKKKKNSTNFTFIVRSIEYPFQKESIHLFFPWKTKFQKGTRHPFLGWKFLSHNSPRLDAIFTVNISPLDQMSPLAWPPSPLRTCATLHAIAPLACFQFSRGGSPPLFIALCLLSCTLVSPR